MRHSLPIAPQFYVTAPQACPYLENRQERKLFTALQGEDAQRLNDKLSKQGFRRSQNVLYRPSCSDCSACLSARIDISRFEISGSQKRVMKKNKGLERRPTSLHKAPVLWRLGSCDECFRSPRVPRGLDWWLPGRMRM